MPSGDRSRVWFPEMLDRLRREWRESLAWDELIALRDRVADDLRGLRTERNLRPPTIRCRHCGRIGSAAEPRVSVRAMIISLGRFGITDSATSMQLERQWKAHAKKHGLGLDGRPRPATASKSRPGNAPAPKEAHTLPGNHRAGRPDDRPLGLVADARRVRALLARRLPPARARRFGRREEVRAEGQAKRGAGPRPGGALPVAGCRGIRPLDPEQNGNVRCRPSPSGSAGSRPPRLAGLRAAGAAGRGGRRARGLARRPGTAGGSCGHAVRVLRG